MALTSTETDRAELNRYIQHQEKILIDLNNKLSQRQLVYDRALQRTKQLDSWWNEIQNTSTAKTLELGMIRMYVTQIQNLGFLAWFLPVIIAAFVNCMTY